MRADKNVNAFVPIIVFVFFLIYGLFGHKFLTGSEGFSIELIILMAFSFNVFYLMYHGHLWGDIESAVANKVRESIPVVLILFSVGILIGAWIVSGTIPMLIYWGLKIINPTWLYLFSFLICITFSLLTGTSWGSAGTIGIVMMGLGEVFDADPAINAAAIVGGSFFGDKLSPLSDTTNVASLACNVPLMDHVNSMLYTTIPSAIVASIYYFFQSQNLVLSSDLSVDGNLANAIRDLESIFRFNLILLLPLLIVIWGSVRRKPIVMTLLSSAWVALVLALIFQNFNTSDIFTSLTKGFDDRMISIPIHSDIIKILNRGGLYSLIEGIVVCLLIFAYLGTLDILNAIER